MQFYSHLSDGERDKIAILRAAGRSMAAIARTLGRAKTTITRGHCSGTHFPRAGIRRLHAAGAYQLRRRREAMLEREAALRLFVRDRLAEGWTPEQIVRLVEMWQRTATAGHRLRDNLRLHLSNRTEGRGFMALFDASPQTPSPA